jgi:diaminopimelate epimerase
MNITFYKYEGAGNDFIMIDNRDNSFPKNNISLIHKLCDRHFGIGADGLILLEDDPETDFKMTYYNADGEEGTMCGNGGRCIVSFANKLGVISSNTMFNAIDGLHHATIKNDLVSLQMADVKKVEVHENFVFANTGSPHHVQLVKNVETYDVVSNGRKLRDNYGNVGSNINFVQQIGETAFKVRTYERGVEDETLACGTGVTAVAIAMHKTNKTNSNNIKLSVLGGELEVAFVVENECYKNVFLKGPATFVFKGTIEI